MNFQPYDRRLLPGSEPTGWQLDSLHKSYEYIHDQQCSELLPVPPPVMQTLTNCVQ